MTDNRVAVVTGASSGIGAAIASSLAQAGYQVYGGSRRTAGEPAPGVEQLTVDVDEDASVLAAVAEGDQGAGPMGLLVNAAGYLCRGGIEETPLAGARSQFETNYFGVVRMTQAALPGM